MYIGPRNKKSHEETMKKVDGFLAGSKNRQLHQVRKKADEYPEEKREELREERIPRNTLHHWRAAEHEMAEKSSRWLLYVALILLAIISYAVYSNSPVMAITFILIGVSGYMFLNKKPRILTFALTQDGVVAGNELYDYYDITSFWIFYEPGEMKVISLLMKKKLIPYVHIPIGDEDPVKLREILLRYVQEERQELSAADKLERILGL